MAGRLRTKKGLPGRLFAGVGGHLPLSCFQAATEIERKSSQPQPKVMGVREGAPP